MMPVKQKQSILKKKQVFEIDVQFKVQRQNEFALFKFVYDFFFNKISF